MCTIFSKESRQITYRAIKKRNMLTNAYAPIIHIHILLSSGSRKEKSLGGSGSGLLKSILIPAKQQRNPVIATADKVLVTGLHVTAF